ncbi:hypothetical protein [Virgibacillus sp. DJP39]|uniref:hypothetical protein n=1 Tax=Virgibacillus sp. DJP39 TaxID=3409790 RepID=UPI003BB5B9DE
MRTIKSNEEEQLKTLMCSVYTKANAGASLQEIMKELTSQLPGIIKQEKAVK